MDRASLVSKSLRAAVAILYAFTFIFAGALLYRYGGLSKDAGWTWRMTASGAVVDAVSAQGPASVLAPGARVIAINGDRRAAAAGPRSWLNALRPGESYRITWTAPDSSQTREATLKMSSRKSPGDLMMGLCDLVLSLCYFAAGLFIWRAKPSGAVARPCYIVALLTAFYTAASAIGPVSPLLSGIPAVIYLTNKLIFPFYLTAGCAFFAVFPTGEKPRGLWRASLVALWAGAVIVWAIVLPTRVVSFLGLEWRLKLLSGLDLNTRPELGLVTLRHGYVVLCGLFLFAVIVHNCRRLENAAMRLRVRWVIFGAVVGVAPAVAASLLLAISPHTTGALLVYYSLSTLSMAAIPATRHLRGRVPSPHGHPRGVAHRLRAARRSPRAALRYARSRDHCGRLHVGAPRPWPRRAVVAASRRLGPDHRCAARCATPQRAARLRRSRAASRSV